MSNRRFTIIENGKIASVQNVDAFGAFNGVAAKILERDSITQSFHARLNGTYIAPYNPTFEVARPQHDTPGWYSNFDAGIHLHTVDDFGTLIELSIVHLTAAVEFIIAGSVHDLD